MENNIGHNDHLKQIASGIKALIEEQDRIKMDIADRYAEAKSVENKTSSKVVISVFVE